MRYTGISVGQQFASVVTSGLAPTVAAALTLWSGGALWSVALYVIGAAFVTRGTVWWLGETSEVDL